MFKRRHKAADAKAAASRSEQELLIERRLASLRDTTAREVMTPRVDVVALEEPVSYEDVARAVRRSAHSHFPVYEGDLDQLVGVLYVKDLFHLGPLGSGTVPSTAEVSKRLREPYLVPESRLVLELLAEMRRLRRSFAVVVDEHGGVAGVLTINALVSELVGDLQDEYDESAPPEIERVDQSRWLVDGSTSVDDVREEIGAPIPEGDYVTLGGYIFDLFGRIPKEGETAERSGWGYRVTEMDRRRVDKVVVQAPAAHAAKPVAPAPETPEAAPVTRPGNGGEGK
ncbi:MAG: hemolysin family protein [Acidimicrobiales bacterium]